MVGDWGQEICKVSLDYYVLPESKETDLKRLPLGKDETTWAIVIIIIITPKD